MLLVQWHDDFSINEIGGGPIHVKNIINNMTESSHIVISSRDSKFQGNKKISSNSLHVSLPKKHFFNKMLTDINERKYYPFKLFQELHTFNSKIKFLNEIKYDILHLHGVSLYPILRNINKWLGLRLYQKVITFSSLNRPKIITLHNFFPGFNNDKNIISLYNHYIDQFNNIICVDKQIYDYCKDYCKHNYLEKRIWYVPNSVDLKSFKSNLKSKKETLNLGIVGRISRTLDLEMIAKLIDNLPSNLHLHLALSGNISNLNSKKLQSSNVTLFLNLENDQINNFYESLDLVFNPVLHSGITRVTMESMASGVPVIMYKNEFRDSRIVNDDNSYIVDQSFDHLQQLLRATSRDRSDLERKSRLGTKTAKSFFSNSVIFPKLKKIYKEILNSN